VRRAAPPAPVGNQHQSAVKGVASRTITSARTHTPPIHAPIGLRSGSGTRRVTSPASIGGAAAHVPSHASSTQRGASYVCTRFAIFSYHLLLFDVFALPGGDGPVTAVHWV
jgi:hypothetical protein